MQDNRVRSTPPWLVERMVHRIGPRSTLGGGCRVPWLAVLGVVLVLVVLATVSFWLMPRGGSDSAGAVGTVASPTPAVANPTPAQVPVGPAATATSPPTPPPAKVMPSPSPFKYRVQAGDTLGAIAIKYGTSVQAIMETNNLSSNLLHIGDELIIPQPAPTPR